MNKFLAALLLVATIAVSTTSAFTSQGAPSLTRRQNAAPLGPAFEVPTPTSSTALNLKIKVDPNAKETKNVKGNQKMAAYGGSVVIAVLLPVAFLVWSAVSK
mmetsp:Transcript_28254/g.51082  ORF Transcript_28254/g.51082 Transcript_28254/m.51082 type:complete len:102 (+) Transcript_28254:137-442(+)|eukprot:CAMPEP_0201869434 /NCGR_PEP_ID=MMETSP0902-20130614/2949_1 /ASSEMBLY_ACC=CAM_ASM_000551 /TAXON_ID=420261 /ORGANISM="Thalassiosira antarctica, Strain CCMP982" /LENGTH=101 /DNA_ID=CAMNT_0048394937 /DNA_START=108 /DNA_END=413 /DNA_ORIENTATION=-